MSGIQNTSGGNPNAFLSSQPEALRPCTCPSYPQLKHENDQLKEATGQLRHEFAQLQIENQTLQNDVAHDSLAAAAYEKGVADLRTALDALISERSILTKALADRQPKGSDEKAD